MRCIFLARYSPFCLGLNNIIMNQGRVCITACCVYFSMRMTKCVKMEEKRDRGRNAKVLKLQ